MHWANKKTQQLLDLRAEGLSCSECAERLGVTRNMVIGKLYRIAMRASRGLGPMLVEKEVVVSPPITHTRPEPKLHKAGTELLLHLLRRLESPLVVREIDEAIVAVAQIREIAADLHGITKPPPLRKRQTSDCGENG